MASLVFHFHLQAAQCPSDHLTNLPVREEASELLVRHRDKKDPTPIQADTALISGP